MWKPLCSQYCIIPENLRVWYFWRWCQRHLLMFLFWQYFSFKILYTQLAIDSKVRQGILQSMSQGVITFYVFNRLTQKPLLLRMYVLMLCRSSEKENLLHNAQVRVRFDTTWNELCNVYSTRNRNAHWFVCLVTGTYSTCILSHYYGDDQYRYKAFL